MNPAMYRVGWYKDGDLKVSNSWLTWDLNKAQDKAHRLRKQGKVLVEIRRMDDNGQWVRL